MTTRPHTGAASPTSSKGTTRDGLVDGTLAPEACDGPAAPAARRLVPSGESAVAEERAGDAGEGQEAAGLAFVASVEASASGEPGHDARRPGPDRPPPSGSRPGRPREGKPFRRCQCPLFYFGWPV